MEATTTLDDSIPYHQLDPSYPSSNGLRQEIPSLPLDISKSDISQQFPDSPQPDSLLGLQIQALTWSAQAKDAAIVSFRSKLLFAQAQLLHSLDVNRRLEAHLHSQLQVEQQLQQQLAETGARLERLAIAEDSLATQIADLEAESLERAILDRRRIDTLEAHLKDKDEILRTMNDRIRQLGAAHQTDSAAQLEHATKRFQNVERKLAEAESLCKSKDIDLAKSKAEMQKLQEKMRLSDASRLKLQKTNKHRQRLHKADQHEVYSVKVLDGSSVSFKLSTETCV